jgi:hypothetical protein
MNYEEASLKYLEDHAKWIPVTIDGEEDQLYACRYNGKLLSHADTYELRLLIEAEMRKVHEDDESRKLVHRLGKTQAEIYHCLMEHGSWYEGCGWIWDNYSQTTRVLDSLVKRGLAYKVTRQARHGQLFAGPQYYPITNDWLAEWFAPGGSRSNWDRYVKRARDNMDRLLSPNCGVLERVQSK